MSRGYTSLYVLKQYLDALRDARHPVPPVSLLGGGVFPLHPQHHLDQALPAVNRDILGLWAKTTFPHMATVTHRTAPHPTEQQASYALALLRRMLEHHTAK